MPTKSSPGPRTSGGAAAARVIAIHTAREELRTQDAFAPDSDKVVASGSTTSRGSGQAMESKYYRNWHLAKTNSEFLVTEFEWALIRLHEAFARWVATSSSVLIDEDIKFSEHMILHVIRMHDRPKNSVTIARMMNRDDVANIQYSLRKLEAANLIVKSREKSGKTFAYTVTEKGNQITQGYADIRSDLLLRAISTIANIDERIAEMTQTIGVLTGIYEEMARSAATFSTQY
ncbi:winged helix DNA-binding protein [Novosphingobium sp. Fuku2-ISO-50]|uniref:winged helix DNA-binding protein n=1 Tax=Novosphingobium sp. Fuku2-ISO-50 TaxID=1739114 RepID=UPI000AB894D5|nr:winged helix DNA-binding protein [Novosphingobium sp. Fuku2-ISO-50]